MKNSIFFLFKSKICINVKGNNIERFIKRLKNNNIEITSIEYISNKETNIKIYKQDYDKVISIKTIYEIEILNYYGLIKIKNSILNNKYIIIFITICLLLLYILTNMIFNIDIITNDSKMEKVLLEELDELGIKKYNFKKDYNSLQVIKEKLLKNHKDEIEWIEIESIGTKYIIRYEPRIKNKDIKNSDFRNIVASKSAIIRHMDISSGQIIKDINSYVKKGDIIVSGYIDLNGNVKDTVSSEGKVYGETWYKVSIDYPYKYREVKTTGKSKKVLVFKIINNEIELFNFNKYKTKRKINKTILKNNLLPIKFISQKQKETIVIDENNTEKEVIKKAINLSTKKINERLSDGEYINNYKVLNMTKYKDSIALNIFYSVIEDITEYQTIQEYQEQADENIE